jgi:site-specific DNA-methyltransferase (cytosine-N4-specific)
MTAIVARGDAADLHLPDESVDLIVTSPPYFGLRSYTDGGEHYDGQIGAESTPAEYIAALLTCTREWARVLKPAGSIWVDLGDKYATGNSGESGMAKLGEQYRGGGHREAEAKIRSGPVPGFRAKSLIGLPWRYALGCIDDLGLILRAEVIWAKPNGLPESVTDRVRRSHETWFHLVKQPRYYAAVDAIREPTATIGRTWEERRAAGEPGRNRGGSNSSTGLQAAPITTLPTFAPNPLGKLPGSVWTIATQPFKAPPELAVDHYAAFPMEWPRRIISGWSPPGGLVLDPCGGTGTTALVASVLGRVGISVDMSADYCRIAQWRTADPKQRERAAR